MGVTYFERWRFSINEGKGPANIHINFRTGYAYFYVRVPILGYYVRIVRFVQHPWFQKPSDWSQLGWSIELGVRVQRTIHSHTEERWSWPKRESVFTR